MGLKFLGKRFFFRSISCVEIFNKFSTSLSLRCKGRVISVLGRAKQIVQQFYTTFPLRRDFVLPSLGQGRRPGRRSVEIDRVFPRCVAGVHVLRPQFPVLEVWDFSLPSVVSVLGHMIFPCSHSPGTQVLINICLYFSMKYVQYHVQRSYVNGN